MKLNNVLFISLLAGFLCIGFPKANPHSNSVDLNLPSAINQNSKLDSALFSMVSQADQDHPSSEDQVQVTLELSTLAVSNNSS